jgi:PPOX class probable F420-dependent enzyme
VPICFVLLGSTVYHAIDGKPKQADIMRLGRVRNLLANPQAMVVVDHYEEDWRRLWWMMLGGEARLLLAGDEQSLAVAALKKKYPQYRDGWPLGGDAPVIALDVARLRYWQSSSPAHRPGAHQDPGA